MAFFSNGGEGHSLDDQCDRCKYGQAPCPIAFVQMFYNYDQHDDKTGTASKILSALVKDDGTCEMYKLAKADFAIDPDQLSLFE